ncbi:MAG: hypothetical protein OXE86_09530 [Alphaproteobacteria bacterium]|nr:hypothetical protein [Alphaproteobacteria bacterium]
MGPEGADGTAAELDRRTIAQGRVQSSADAPPLLTVRAGTWQTIRDHIVEGHGREARSWLQDIDVTVTDDSVVLQAPSPAAADYVDRTYGALISSDGVRAATSWCKGVYHRRGIPIAQGVERGRVLLPVTGYIVNMARRARRGA